MLKKEEYFLHEGLLEEFYERRGEILCIVERIPP
jgi:hypothetical protein